MTQEPMNLKKESQRRILKRLAQKVEISELEVAYGFVTVWGNRYPLIRDFAKEVYKALPLELRKINNKNLAFHKEELFHYFGAPNIVRQGENFRHFHIILPHPSDGPHLDYIIHIYDLLLTPGIPITFIENRISPSINIDDAINRSKQLYKEYLSGRA